MSKDDLVTIFGYQVLEAAEWQRRKAKESPADTRHQKAAEVLELLYSEIEGFCGSPIEEEISDLDVRLREAGKDHPKIWTEIHADVSGCLGSMGFHEKSFKTGLSLVEWYRDLLQGKLGDMTDVEKIGQCDSLKAEIARLRAAGHDAFMAMCQQRDNPDAEVFQDAIDALGRALNRS